jgi:hypothetical protein
MRMSPDDLKPGCVIRYPYLWSRQQSRGETEGRKERPVCLVYARRDDARSLTHLFLLAISSQPPLVAEDAVILPDLERQRAGLGDWSEAWVTISETNYDILEHSHYLNLSEPILGAVSPSFLRKVALGLRSALIAGGRRVDRTT